MKTKLIVLAVTFMSLVGACKKDDTMSPTPLNPDTAGDVSIDRFSSSFAHLFLRTAQNSFPAANAPIDFDAIPAFNTNGLGPHGEKTIYYNFDVLPTTPAPIYVLYRSGETASVSGQLNIVNVIPGDAGYNDFWLVTKVTVPSNYVANTVTSYDEILKKGYTLTPTTTIVNCPIVPKGSVARKRYSTESSALTLGWYHNKVVYYFNFFEKDLVATSSGKVPVAPIYVSFNINPDQTNGGPPSGFKTEDGTPTGQTHNVPAVLPADALYSPLWAVQIYNNTSFGTVSNLTTAMAAPLMAMDAAIVNCPIVSVR